MPTRPLPVVLLLSLSLLALELAWTRIFSAEFFYSFAVLILCSPFWGSGSAPWRWVCSSGRTTPTCRASTQPTSWGPGSECSSCCGR